MPQRPPIILIVCILMGGCVLIASSIGCGDLTPTDQGSLHTADEPTDSNNSDSSATGSDAPRSTSATPSTSVSLDIADWDEAQTVIKQHKGKVVVVDIWTTTCLTCIEEFPNFVQLQRDYGDQGLVCVSLNCDFDGIESKPPDYYRQRVEQFLVKQKAEFPNILLAEPFLDFLDEIELSSTPAILVYGRDGKVAKRFDNDNISKAADEYQMSDVRNLVEQLLSGQPNATSS